MKVLHLDTGGEWRGGQQQLLHLAEHMPESVVLLPHGPLLDRLRTELNFFVSGPLRQLIMRQAGEPDR